MVLTNKVQVQSWLSVWSRTQQYSHTSNL